MLEETNELMESLPSDETVETTETESSTEAIEEGDSQTPEVKEPPFNEHPRWKEVQAEKRAAQERADRLEQQLLEISGKLATPKSEDKDPYDGLTPEEKVFWESIDKRTRKTVEEAVDKARREEREAAEARFAKLEEASRAATYKEIITQYPEVKPGSDIEMQVAQKIKMGYNPFDACELIVGKIRLEALQNKSAVSKKQREQQMLKDKVAANSEVSTMSSTSPLSQSQMSADEKLKAFVRERMSQATK